VKNIKPYNFIMFQDAPDAPRNLEIVELNRGAISLEWLPPRHDGGAPIRGYIVERCQGYSSRWQRLTKTPIMETWYRDTTIVEEMDYEYRISAENEAGVGAYSIGTGPIVPRDPFGMYKNIYM
jgi:hypothetical protein